MDKEKRVEPEIRKKGRKKTRVIQIVWLGSWVFRFFEDWIWFRRFFVVVIVNSAQSKIDSFVEFAAVPIFSASSFGKETNCTARVPWNCRNLWSRSFLPSLSYWLAPCACAVGAIQTGFPFTRYHSPVNLCFLARVWKALIDSWFDEQMLINFDLFGDLVCRWGKGGINQCPSSGERKVAKWKAYSWRVPWLFDNCRNFGRIFFWLSPK